MYRFQNLARAPLLAGHPLSAAVERGVPLLACPAVESTNHAKCRVTALWCAIFVTAFAAGPARAADEKIDLTPRFQPAQTLRVTVNFEAGGNALVRVASTGGFASSNGEPAAASVGAAGSASAPTETQLPISVNANLQYDERRLVPVRGATVSASVRPGTPLAVRHYHDAQATIKVDKGGLTPRLADSRRLIVVAHSEARPALYSAAGPLPRDELDLIDVVGNSTVLDQLLPAYPVASGDSWPADAATMAGLLTFDTVTVCEMQNVLEEFNASFAKIRLAGVVHGTADGTPTEQEVRAVYLFDRRLGRVARMNIAAREKRSIGGATPGLDAVAKLQIKLEPAPADTPLADAAVTTAARTPRPTFDVLYDAPSLGFRLTHDRQWYLTSQTRQAVTLRRVQQGEVLATCTITALAPKPAGTTLEQFQRDIAQALGSNFGEMVAARQWLSTKRNYCYGVVARGAVEQVPIEWHYYLLTDPETGHRASVAITIEGPKVEQLAQADRTLVEAIELFAPQPQSQAKAASPTVK
jgi:hypothetical protein